MKIVIPGGTGHLGNILTRHFRAAGHNVIVLSRNVEAHALVWDGRTLGAWGEAIEGADVVINLAGRSVDTRYNAAKRAEIIRSRENTAARLVAGEHRHDLRTHLRRSERRIHGRHRRA